MSRPAVIELVRDIVRRHGVRPQHVVGHSDIAPQRTAALLDVLTAPER